MNLFLIWETLLARFSFEARLLFTFPKTRLFKALLSLSARVYSAIIHGLVRFKELHGLHSRILTVSFSHFYFFTDIMGNRLYSTKPIETKVHAIELSLLPPNINGIMPAGNQRFPFEFPLPGSLPITLSIPDRLDIFYQLKATLRKSYEETATPRRASWFDWVRPNKKTLVATADLRLVRAIEPIPSLTPAGAMPTFPINRNNLAPLLRLQQQQQANETNIMSDGSASHGYDESRGGNTRQEQHRRTSLDRYFAIDQEQAVDDWSHGGSSSGNELQQANGQVHLGLALDEQHDRLAYSMAGRTIDNFCCPVKDMKHGLRYRLTIDRTAIAIGTSIGIEVMLEPMLKTVNIKSIVLKISESREYNMKIPKSGGSEADETRQQTENVAMVLKWAYGYPTDVETSSHSSSSESVDSKGKKKCIDCRPLTLSRRYRHHSHHWSDDVNFNQERRPNRAKWDGQQALEPLVFEDHGAGADYADDGDNPESNGELLNLKQLDQPIHVGEYFEGRFVMPVPTCEHLLRPSMVHESITIRHWLRLVVVAESQGKMVEVSLTTPVRILDCRVVSADDERQTILPPPPSYENIDNAANPKIGAEDDASSNFWMQRLSITQDAIWGSCLGCPCKQKRAAKVQCVGKGKAPHDKSTLGPGSKRVLGRESNNSSSATSETGWSSATASRPPPGLQIEWGPPPSYSEH